MNTAPAARAAAAFIALVAWTGLAVQLVVSYHLSGSALATVWIVFAYFTIWTNVLVAIVFTAIAAARPSPRSCSVVAGTTLSIVLVGAIYALLLHGLTELSGGSAVANVLLHRVTPILVPLFWIAFTPKGKLTRLDPLLWAAYTLAYLVYALARGSATGRYPYPFLDALHLGWPRVALNAALIAAAFLLAAFALVGVDNRLARRSTAPAL